MKLRHLGHHAVSIIVSVGCWAMSSSAVAEMLPKWELGIGVGGFSLPDYRGSDEVRNYVLPFPYVIYRLDWLKVDRTGLSSRLFNSDRVELNLSMSATPPVLSKKNRAREGMADIKPLLEFGTSLDTHLWRSSNDRIKLDLRMPLRVAFTVQEDPHQEGLNFTPRLNLDIKDFIRPKWNLGMLTGPIFATRRQNQYFYGVPESDARADRPAYNAPGGYAGTQFLISLSHRFEKTWFGAYARYDTLQNAVFEDSPLMRRNHYVSAGIAMAWTLSQSATMVERDDDDSDNNN
ncbi:MAG TPA: MipA/OmpV family protein [Rhodocyclaceae bacterium]|nr:MipA/OmpV family protein [Rhodocyclaceae bacterium]